jgi:hypothetical protein
MNNVSEKRLRSAFDYQGVERLAALYKILMLEDLELKEALDSGDERGIFLTIYDGGDSAGRKGLRRALTVLSRGSEAHTNG